MCVCVLVIYTHCCLGTAKGESMSTDKGKHVAADVDEKAAAAIGGTHYACTIHTSIPICNTQ